MGDSWGRYEGPDRLGIPREAQIVKPLAPKQVVAAFLALGKARERMEMAGGEWREEEEREWEQGFRWVYYTDGSCE